MTPTIFRVWASNLQFKIQVSSGIRHCSHKRYFLKKPTSFNEWRCGGDVKRQEKWCIHGNIQNFVSWVHRLFVRRVSVYGYWLIFLAVVNRVCPGWQVGNEGGFRLVVPKKRSDKSLVLFCVFGAGDAFARNMRGLFWLGCAIRKCESVYSGSIINLKCHSSKNVL